MLNDMVLHISPEQVSLLSLHLLNILSIDDNSTALKNFLVLLDAFLSVTMNSPHKKQCFFQ